MPLVARQAPKWQVLFQFQCCQKYIVTKVTVNAKRILSSCCRLVGQSKIPQASATRRLAAESLNTKEQKGSLCQGQWSDRKCIPHSESSESPNWGLTTRFVALAGMCHLARTLRHGMCCAESLVSFGYTLKNNHHFTGSCKFQVWETGVRGEGRKGRLQCQSVLVATAADPACIPCKFWYFRLPISLCIKARWSRPWQRCCCGCCLPAALL